MEKWKRIVTLYRNITRKCWAHCWISRTRQRQPLTTTALHRAIQKAFTNYVLWFCRRWIHLSPFILGLSGVRSENPRENCTSRIRSGYIQKIYIIKIIIFSLICLISIRLLDNCCSEKTENRCWTINAIISHKTGYYFDDNVMTLTIDFRPNSSTGFRHFLRKSRDTCSHILLEGFISIARTFWYPLHFRCGHSSNEVHLSGLKPRRASQKCYNRICVELKPTVNVRRKICHLICGRPSPMWKFDAGKFESDYLFKNVQHISCLVCVQL